MGTTFANLKTRIVQKTSLVRPLFSHSYTRRKRTVALVFALATVCVSFSQGVATRNVEPEVRAKPSGKPFLAKFTDAGADAGLNMTFSSGDEKTKKYIVE